MDYTVSRDGATLVTLHEGTDTTACDTARAELSATLRTLQGDDQITDWTIEDADVYEHPAAPFDPYTISVAFTVTVTVDATDLEAATAIGETTIEAALERADVGAVSYTTGPAVSAS